MYNQAELSQLSGDTAAAHSALEQVIEDLTPLAEAESAEIRVVEFLALAERLLALQALDRGEVEQASRLIGQANERLLAATRGTTIRPRTVLPMGRVAETLGRVQRMSGNETAAISTWRAALDFLSARPEPALAQIAVEKQIANDLGEARIAAERARQLSEAGFNDSRFP